MEYTFSSVFSSATYPEYTYVNRKSSEDFTYDERLKMALEQRGYLIVIDGPSKIGKTVLCEAVIGIENLVSMTGNDFKGAEDFWAVIARKVELPLSGEVRDSRVTHTLEEQAGTSYTSQYQTNKERVLKFFLDHHKVLLLDDFHYAEEAIQHDAACQLKEAIRLGLKVIIVSLPNRVDQSVKNNPDLQGRILNITMRPWKPEELVEIPQKGFRMLGVKASQKMIDRLVMECIDSPQTMQSLCENVGYYLPEDKTLTDEAITKSCRMKADYLPYQTLYEKVLNGPPSRGQQRSIYYLKDGMEVDRYGLILEALRRDPPMKAITKNEIYDRAKELLDTDRTKAKLTPQTVAGIIRGMVKVLEKSGSEADKVFEWEESKLIFREPLFLFYLRWRNDE